MKKKKNIEEGIKKLGCHFLQRTLVTPSVPKFNIKHLWRMVAIPRGWLVKKGEFVGFISRGNETQIKLASFLVISAIARGSRFRVFLMKIIWLHVVLVFFPIFSAWAFVHCDIASASPSFHSFPRM